MAYFAKAGVRPSLLCTALGLLIASAGPVSAAYSPDFVVPLDGYSTNTDPTFQHPIGELGFSFISGGVNSCTLTMLCLDLSIKNATATAPANTTGVQSSRMVSAGFDVPGLWDGTQFLPSPPSFGGLKFTNPAANFISNPSVYAGDDLNGRPGAFSQLDVNGDIPGLATFDLCPGISDCLSQGSPNSGLANGESTIVRFMFDYDGTTPVSDISNAFFTYYEDVDARHTGGRWKAINYTYCVPDSDPLSCTVVEGASDKIAGGPPTDPNVPPEGDQVPGPLPLMGAATAFGFSRKLRHRIATGQRRIAYTL